MSRDGDGSDTSRDGDTNGTDANHEDDHPIEGTAFLKAAVLASVPADRLSFLLSRVQDDLAPRIDEYRRRYERVVAEPERETFLVEPDHWDEIGERLGLSTRERDAVARAHEAAVERTGSAADRREEFETALEIRTGVVIGTDCDSREDETGNDRVSDSTDNAVGT